jgi:hypothetical protein
MMIMTPKEKAIELYNNFRNQNSIMSANIRGKKCAIIAVNEILNINSVDKDYELSNYWNEVLTELNNL